MYEYCRIFLSISPSRASSFVARIVTFDLPRPKALLVKPRYDLEGRGWGGDHRNQNAGVLTCVPVGLQVIACVTGERHYLIDLVGAAVTVMNGVQQVVNVGLSLIIAAAGRALVNPAGVAGWVSLRSEARDSTWGFGALRSDLPSRSFPL